LGWVGGGLGGARANPPLLQENETHDTESKLPEALNPLLGVRPYPSRIRCATLPWTAAQRALAD
jgi:NifU-like protein involved in Fe-S cluster formation